MINITTENYEQEVMQAKGTVLVDFWAAWCGPCKMISPVIDEIAASRPDIKVCKINIDDEPELAIKNAVMSIPTLMVVKDGQVVNKAVGLRPRDEIEAML